MAQPLPVTGDPGPEPASPAAALFADPAARALGRVGVVDVGSNSVRMVVFDGAARSPAYFFNEKVLCGLGIGMAQTGRLNPEGRRRALAALRRFSVLARGMKVTPLIGVATAAIREAADGGEFVAEVAREAGIALEVIPGRQEARLSAQGVLLGWPGAQGLVCDIGGSSMELAELAGGGVGTCETSPLGPLRLEALGLKRAALKDHIGAEIARLRRELPGTYARLFLVGGSWRAIARLDMARRGYPLTVLHEYEMSPKALLATASWLRGKDVGRLQALSGTSADRLRLVPLAAQVLRALIRTFGPRRVAISGYGLREGLLYEQMPERLRRRDPLLEACRHMEASAARQPGFGSVLYGFLLPIFRNQSPETLRLIRAACLLHDVTWRAHPDYRAEVCFDNATRANLGGLDHRGRVFLGTALLHRYKNSRSGTAFESVSGLLTARELALAETVGKAMRFGAMLTAATPELMGRLVFRPKLRQLELHLGADGEALFGEVAAARFEALSRALGAEARVLAEGRNCLPD